MAHQPTWEEIVERMNELRPDGVVFREQKGFSSTGDAASAATVLTQAHEHLAAKGATHVTVTVSVTYNRPENEIELHRRALNTFSKEYDPEAIISRPIRFAP